MKVRRLVVLDRYLVDIEETEIDESVPGAVKLKVEYSGISAGTELSVVKGTNVRLSADGWTPVNDPGLARLPGLRYPVHDLGYMETGTVVDSRDPAFPVGCRVALACGHCTAAVVSPTTGKMVILPDDVDPVHGIWVSTLLPICANALLHAAAEFEPSGPAGLASGVRGRRVAVFGAGVIGLIIAYWAAELGAKVLVVDRTPARLRAASALGLDVLADDGQAAWKIRAAWRYGGTDTGADLVFQTRGTVAALVAAMRSVRPGHAIVDLAFYQTSCAELHLGEDFHHAGIVLRAAQIGNLPRALRGQWSHARLIGEGLELLRGSGSLLADVLVTDVVSFGEAPGLLMRMARDRSGRTLQAVLTMDL